jgi:hypothetical protein
MSYEGRWGVCTKSQTARINRTGFIVIQSIWSQSIIITFFILYIQFLLLLNVTREAAINLPTYVIANSFGGW